MIKAVEVINHSGEIFRVILDNPEESGFALVGMEGITPGKGNINTKEIATLDGGFFQNARLPARNIVLDYVFLDEVDGVYRTIEEARLLFYKYFVIKKPLTLIIETDLHRYQIEGYVESNEPEIFSSMEGAQVSIICPSPYFHLADSSLNENGNASQTIFNQGGSFKFEWSNPRFMYTIQFGNPDDIVREQTTTIYYDGDVDTGIIFHVYLIGDFDRYGSYIDFDYYGDSADNARITFIRFNNYKFEGGLQVGDELVISTIPGQKSAYVKRGAQKINVFSCLDIVDDWFGLQKGPNVIHVNPIVVFPHPPNIYVTMEYPILCAGV